MAGATLSLASGTTAQAAPPPLVITTVQDAVHPPHTPPTGTFEATGLTGCPSGTYADSLVYFTPNGTRVVVDETYTCLDGATFTARVALHIAPTAPDGTQTAEGTWRIVSSDTGLAGSGNLSGLATGCSPVGAVFAECTGASSLVVGKVK
ncbi:MAG: hypothetical protein ACR2F6_08770 [Mycobacteriales bacterium]